MYNPWDHLLSLGQGVTLSVEPTPAGKAAWWSPALDHIILRPDLSRIERRVHLAHELAHRDLGHSAACDGRGSRRQERAADGLAARRLISLCALLDALCWTDCTAQAAEALGVTEHLLDVRLEQMRGGERRWIAVRLKERRPDL